MAKHSNTKQSNKPVPSAGEETSELARDVALDDQPDLAGVTKPPASKLVKDSAVTSRAKKTRAPALRQASWMPNGQKLENLASAIAAAGDAANLLLILDYVDAAGGSSEVIESIEAYRALKTAVEQSGSSLK